MLELEMMNLGIEYLQRQSRFHLISQEVPFLSRCIDVVLLDDSENLISIEFKVSKWRHAIEQAKNHKLGADKAYICLPERKLTEPLIQALSDSQIGLMFFNPNVEEVVYEVIPASNKTIVIPIFREMLLENFLKIANQETICKIL